MTLQDVTNTATILASIALVATAILLYFELRENNRLIRAANSESLVELSSPFNISLIQDRKMAEFYVSGAEEFEAMDAVDKYRYRRLLTWWLIFYENIYYQWRQDLLDTNSYEPWAAELMLFIEHQKLESQWDSLHDVFQDEFANYMRERLEECKRRRSDSSADRQPRSHDP